MTASPISDTHYPDLTQVSATQVDELLADARADLEPVLSRSRLTPLAASPQSGNEPANSLAFLASCPVPVPRHLRSPGASHGNEGAGALHELGVTELLTAFARGEATPSGLLAALRARWADVGLAGGAILAVIDGADAAVAESDRRWDAGTARPLEGIPFAVKDIIDVAGAPVTSGSYTTGERVAQADATVVARLRAAGAIPVLMTATTEFACGAPANVRYGAVTNPWDRTRWTGGSSTGSAGALAARLIPLALGSDTGGSIRIPSALCNLTGIKPTYGLVPRTGVASLSWTLDHIGPMARSAADLRLVLPHVAGADNADPAAVSAEVSAAVQAAFSAEWPEANGVRPLVGLRVGIPSSWFAELCDSGVLAAWRSALDTLVKLGAKVSAVDLGDLALIHDDVTVILTSELASNQEANLDRFGLFDIGTQVRIARGLVPTAADYLRSLRRRVVAQRIAVAALEGLDVLVTPGVGATAPQLADVTVEIDGLRHPMQSIVGRNTGIFNYLGLPAVMAPASLVDGMPVGVQLVGRPWADDMCLRLAEVLQSVTGHHLRRPGDLDE